MEADREWSDRPTSDLIASLRALSQRTPTWTFYAACAERLEALEEIRQRVADGDLVELLRKALMERHHHDWDMDTVSEAAHICAQALNDWRPRA